MRVFLKAAEVEHFIADLLIKFPAFGNSFMAAVFGKISRNLKVFFIRGIQKYLLKNLINW
jgi:hypothetical protein